MQDKSPRAPSSLRADREAKVGSALVTMSRSHDRKLEQLMTTDPCRPLSAVEVQALQRRVLAARDLDVDPDPTDLATAHRINADELAQFDRSWGP